MKRKVAMFVTNPCTHDARVIREAKALASEGYLVRVFALVTNEKESGVFEVDGYSIERVFIGKLVTRE